MGRKRSIADAKESSTPGNGAASSDVRKPRGRPRKAKMNAEVRDLHLKESKADEAMEAKGSTEPSIDEPASDTEIANHTGESSTPGNGAASSDVRKPRGRPRKAKENDEVPAQEAHIDGPDGTEKAIKLSEEERSRQYGTAYYCSLTLGDFLKMKGIRRCGLRPIDSARVQNIVNAYGSAERADSIIALWSASNPVIAMTNSATTGFHSAFTVFQSEMCILKDCSGAFNAKSLLLEGNHRLSATEQFLHHMTRNIMKIPIKIKVIVVPPSDDASLERTLTDDAKVSNKLPPYSRACCRLSTEMDRTEVENTKNEKRTFWETVVHCRDVVVPYLRSAAPKSLDLHLKKMAVSQGLVPSQKSGGPCEPWGFAIDLNYLVPKALFDALEETLFTFKSDDDRRKQTLDRSSTVILKKSWTLNECVVRRALLRLTTLKESHRVVVFNRVLQNVLVEEFTNHMAADAHGEEEAKTKIQAHIDEMNNRLNETNQLNKLSKNDPVEVLGFVIVPAGALEQKKNGKDKLATHPTKSPKVDSAGNEHHGAKLDVSATSIGDESLPNVKEDGVGEERAQEESVTGSEKEQEDLMENDEEEEEEEREEENDEEDEEEEEKDEEEEEEEEEEVSVAASEHDSSDNGEQNDTTMDSLEDADTVDERKDGTFVDDGPGEDNKALSLDDRERRSCSNVTTLDENDIPDDCVTPVRPIVDSSASSACNRSTAARRSKAPANSTSSNKRPSIVRRSDAQSASKPARKRSADEDGESVVHKRHRQADDGNSMEDEILTHEQSYEIECNKYGKIVVVTEIDYLFNKNMQEYFEGTIESRGFIFVQNNWSRNGMGMPVKMPTCLRDAVAINFLSKFQARSCVEFSTVFFHPEACTILRGEAQANAGSRQVELPSTFDEKGCLEWLGVQPLRQQVVE